MHAPTAARRSAKIDPCSVWRWSSSSASRCSSAVRRRGASRSRRRWCCCSIGVLIGFAPAIRRAQLPPQVVLLLFLPALLYWESLTTSLREIRSNLRVVMLASTGAGRGHRRRGGGHRPRARHAVGPGLGAGGRGRADRRHRRRRAGPRPAAPRRHRAARREPDQRRHRAGDLRAGRRGHRGEEHLGGAARHVAAGAVLRRRCARRRAGRAGELAAAPAHGRPRAGEHRDPRDPVRGVPARRLGGRLRGAGRRGVRAAHEPARATRHQRGGPAADDRVLVARDHGAEQRAVRARRAAGTVGRART